jgi:hypothetical protein
MKSWNDALHVVAPRNIPLDDDSSVYDEDAIIDA